ncbi:PREDICTED: uncharacterized protein LOC108562667 [Nicrophorus vespilloides]|uniref:Uncharacterized protein LOC108562667 n=1 Tax=Nicrophorus vespilloides TaxID=110193 RepID=A0ABM1MPS0_NICVS|nr:PREDICTED: uncharacterized protein LOC108562667 [Nicrophorus vespilloides]
MDLRKFVPLDWNYESKTILPSCTSEYNTLREEFRNFHVQEIYRVQNVHRYNMFLVRQQHLLALTPENKCYVVRRYVGLTAGQLESALQHNLDKRINGASTAYPAFKKDLTSLTHEKVILAVNVVTKNADVENFIPTRDSDFYIEYIIEMQ